MSTSIKHEHTLNPVTALEFYKDGDRTLILAGEGSFLKVFDAKTSRLINQYQLSDGQAVHGIVSRGQAIDGVNELQAVIWGGRSLTLLTQRSLDQVLSGDARDLNTATISVSDWILDATLPKYDGNSCILITAHNVVIEAKLDHNTRGILLTELPSPSRSILYSAHVIWDTTTRVLVAAGTVFGEIIVWDIAVSEDGTFGESKILFTFTGHEGSIFGVNISPTVVGPGGLHTRLLASCSDDRTIRIWDLSETSTISTEQNLLNLPRETGFGQNASSITSEQRCVATVMGHASRIWRVKFSVRHSRFCESSIINILSFGEDSTAQQWALDFTTPHEASRDGETSVSDGRLSPQYPGNLRHMTTFAFHSGKHVWSIALLQPDSENDSHLLSTGGADGKISLYNVELMVQDTVPEKTYKSTSCSPRKEWTLDDVYASLLPDDTIPSLKADQIQKVALIDEVPERPLQSTQTDKKKSKKLPRDAFNRYAFISDNEFLVTTTAGRVLLGQIDHSLKWKRLALPRSGIEDLKSYSVVEGYPDLGLVFLGSAKGAIYCYDKHLPEIRKVGNVDGKVADMFKVTGPNFVALLVTTLSSSIATLYPLDPNADQFLAMEKRAAYSLPDRFVVTSAGMSNGLLVLGSRNGSLALYELTEPRQPLYVWNNEACIASDSITSITPLPGAESDGTTYFLTTGRNGIFSVFSTSTNKSETTILPVHHCTPPFGPNIEAAWFSGPNNDLMLSGFRSKTFVVWNETLQQEISNVVCGGAHRSYAYSPLGHFIYTKASRLYIHSQLSPSHKITKRGGHGREIKACAVAPDGQLFATGAEDTAIRIWTYSDSQDPLKLEAGFDCLAVTQRHTAGIQHLQWHGAGYLLSSGGNEEFYIWAVTRIPSFGIGVVCEASCPDQSPERDLRIMSFDVSEVPPAPAPGGPEHQHPFLLISLAYSDSTLKVYTYSKALGFQLRARGRYTSACLTHIKHVSVPVSGGELGFLTAATDGHVTLWACPVAPPHAAPSEPRMLSNKKIHQSAVKALDATLLPPSDNDGASLLVVATGGDDNALALTLLSPRGGGAAGEEPRTFRLGNAHAAAVTGLVFVRGEGGRRLRVVSSGNDQRVREWDVRVDVEALGVGVERRGDVFTSVADVGEVAVLRGRGRRGAGGEKGLVVGIGMGVFEVGLC